MVTYGHRLVARKKISTTVYITPEQDARLKALHVRTKVSVAEYIRQGIDLVLEKYRDQLPGEGAPVLLEDEVDALPDVLRHRDLGLLVQELELRVLLRGDVDGGGQLLPRHGHG